MKPKQVIGIVIIVLIGVFLLINIESVFRIIMMLIGLGIMMWLASLVIGGVIAFIAYLMSGEEKE